MFSGFEAPKQIASLLDNSISPDLRSIARAFVDLQAARHRADYDLDTVWTRLLAEDHAQRAKDAFAAWSRIRRTHEANVFALALLSPKLFERER